MNPPLTLEDLELFQRWAKAHQKALEWSAGERTFQINGIRSMGLWERFFPRPPAHAESRPVIPEEILRALDGATTPIAFWRDERDRVWYENAEAALDAAKAWVEKG